MSIEVKESGDLQNKSSFELIKHALLDSFDGVIVFARAKEKHSLIFQKDQVCIPQNYIQEATFGKYLFDQRLLDNDTYMEIKKKQDQEKLTFYDAVCKSKIVNRENINQFLDNQVISILDALLSWTTGKYMKVEQVPKDVVPYKDKMMYANALFQARVTYFKEQNKLEPIRYPIVWVTENPFSQGIALSKDQKEIISLISKPKYINELAQALKQNDQELLPLIQTMIDFGMVGLQKETPVKGDSKNVFDFEDVLKNHAKKDFYELLGIDRKSSKDQVQARYFEIAKKYHPDRFKGGEGVDKQLVEKVFAKIGEAYQTLKDDAKRREYDDKLESPQDSGQPDIQKVLESENHFLDGMDSLRRGQFEKAIKDFNQAIDLYDQEYEYFLRLGWAKYRYGLKVGNDSLIQEGKKVIIEAMKKERAMDDVYYYNGMVFKIEKNYQKAKVFFQKALSENKRHVQAGLEYRAVEVLLEKSIKSEKKGWFK